MFRIYLIFILLLFSTISNYAAKGLKFLNFIHNSGKRQNVFISVFFLGRICVWFLFLSVCFHYNCKGHMNFHLLQTSFNVLQLNTNQKVKIVDAIIMVNHLKCIRSHCVCVQIQRFSIFQCKWKALKIRQTISNNAKQFALTYIFMTWGINMELAPLTLHCMTSLSVCHLFARNDAQLFVYTRW